MDDNPVSHYPENRHQSMTLAPSEDATTTETSYRRQHDYHAFRPSPISPPPSVPNHLVSPPSSLPHPPASAGVMPQPVVKILSTHGVEYVFMTIALLTSAVGLASALLAVVNGKFTFAVLYVPLAFLLVAVPVFCWLFLRLKQAELLDPTMRLDASKRRSTQFLQISSFLVCFFTLIGLLAMVFAKLNSTYSGSMTKIILDALVILVIAGAILFYYWKEEHKV